MPTWALLVILAWIGLMALIFTIVGCTIKKSITRYHGGSSRTTLDDSQLPLRPLRAHSPNNTALMKGVTPEQLQAIAPLCEANSQQMCAVCQEDIEKNVPARRITACGHLFHSACIRVWLRRRRICPTCETVLSDSNSDGSMPNDADKGMTRVQLDQLISDLQSHFNNG